MKYLKTFFHYLGFPFVAIAALFNVRSIKKKAKKYRKDPKSVFANDRYKLIYKACNKYIYLKNLKLEIDGFKSLPHKPMLYVCNHKSNIDPAILYKVIYDQKDLILPCFLAKEEIKKSKTFGSALELLDCITINRDNLRSVYEGFKKQEELVEQGHSIFIFPEGTRVKEEETFGEFHDGSLKVAYQKFITIVPISLYGTVGMQDKNAKKVNKSKVVYVKALKPLQPINFINIKQTNLMETIKNEIAKEYKVLQKMNHEKKPFPKEK